ncbi:MAG: amidohydrolase [Gemmatimonadaceae bacterium]|nr:amidohydrolase [Gemmatimonadaceae bacterium]
MRRISRHEFLGIAALLAGGWKLPRAPRALHAMTPAPPPPLAVRGQGIEADSIVVNASVYTQDAALPTAEAFAVKEGRFLAVGNSSDIRNLATARTQVIDGRGMTVLPGFIDTHSHPSGVAELFDVNANVRTLAELQRALRERAAKTPPGEWVTGEFFDDTKLDRPLTRRDLDAVSTTHPIAVHHRGGHTSFYNSLAFANGGVTRETPDPSDGRYFRDADGELSGRVAELARDRIERAGTRPVFTPAQERERAVQGMAHISRLMTAAGLTSVHSAWTGAELLTAYEEARRAGQLKHRAYLMMAPAAYEKLRDAGVQTGFGDAWIRIGGVKYAADGSASERTMRMSTPYVGTNDYGILTMTQAEIDAAVDDAHSHGWQVGIHANGDVTIGMVLSAYERALAKWPHPDRRHRIEHCSLVTPELIARIRATGSIPTPFWTYIYYHGEKWAQYGDEKMRSMFCHRSFLDVGIAVPGASDYQPGPFEPMMALQSMVTRRDYRGKEWGPNQRVTVAEAIRIGTLHGARASYEEREKGSITAGKLTDYVMLAQDPHRVDPLALKDIAVVRTVTGGATVFERS